MKPLSYSKTVVQWSSVLVLLCCTNIKSFTQNLVIDPSFENVNLGSLRCSWYISAAQFNSAMASWTCPTGGSTDIFHTSLSTSCYASPFSTHSANPGIQAPRTGNSYCNLVTYGNGGCDPWREYVQGRLSSPMVVGQQYEVSMYVTLADKMSLGTNNIGVKFSTTPYSQAGNCGYYTTPDLNYTGPPILDKTNWVQIYFTYTPTVAGLDNLIIGNFFNDVATSTTLASGVRAVNTIRYYIEDVVVAPIILLPMELTNFEANCDASNVSITWSTLSELNNDYFEIERSENGFDFESIATIPRNKNKSNLLDYHWIDGQPLHGTAYYRIKQNDIDGHFSYSEIAAVTCDLSEQAIGIFPNPFDQNVNLRFWNPIEEDGRLRVMDCTGRVVYEQVLQAQSQAVDLAIGQKLTAGVYYIKVDLQTASYTRKLIKK